MSAVNVPEGMEQVGWFTPHGYLYQDGQYTKGHVPPEDWEPVFRKLPAEYPSWDLKTGPGPDDWTMRVTPLPPGEGEALFFHIRCRDSGGVMQNCMAGLTRENVPSLLKYMDNWLRGDQR